METKAGVKCEYKNDKTPLENKGNLVLFPGAIYSPSGWNGEAFVCKESILQNDTVVYGDLNILKDLNLNGKELVVEGNLNHCNGIININGGRLIVKGDFLQKRKVWDDEGIHDYESAFYLKMNNELDYVLVYGDYINESSYINDEDILTAGTMEIKGDYKQIGIDRNFVSKDSHKVILSGEKMQNVYVTNPWDCCFNILELKNSKGINFESRVLVKKEIIPTQINIENKQNLFLSLDVYSGLSQWSYAALGYNCYLKDDIYEMENLCIVGNLDLRGKTIIVNENVTMEFGEINFNGGTIVVKGTLNQKNGKINIGADGVLSIEGDVLQRDGTTAIGEGGKCRIGGSVIQQGGNIKIGGGRLEVNGDYRQSPIISNSENKETPPNNFLEMNNEKDYVFIGGSYIAYSTFQGYLYGGTMEVKGDIIQLSSENYSATVNSFRCSGSHRVILSGDKQQSISFKNPWDSYFNILEIANTSKEGVKFDSLVIFKTKYINNGVPVINPQNLRLTDGAVYTLPEWQGDLNISSKLRLNADLTVMEDVNLSTELDLMGKILIVNGDLNINEGSIAFNSGTIIVKGNVNHNGKVTVLYGGVYKIEGDLNI